MVKDLIRVYDPIHDPSNLDVLQLSTKKEKSPVDLGIFISNREPVKN